MWIRVALITVAMLGASAGTARAQSGELNVPIDAISRIGDERVGFPEYFSDTYYVPSATVAGVGDVNGDGLEDTAIHFDTYEPSHPVSVWVNFSQPVLPLTVEAGTPPWRGFGIVGDWTWYVVNGLDDVNGDLLEDVVVWNDGSFVVVFGRLDGQTVDLDNLGDDGFEIVAGGPCPTGGAGSAGGGMLMYNKLATPVGDQNGDGVRDLAFCADGVVQVVFTPADPAGKVVSLATAGGFTLDPSTRVHNGPFPVRLGDLDNDGREDLGVVWQESGPSGASPHTVHASGVISPASGSTVDLSQVAEAGTGFELHAPDSYLENALSIGDQNGDGIREVGWVAFGADIYRNRTLVMTYSPPIGTDRVAYPVVPGTGEEIYNYGGDVSDVGDQDGDGKADIAYDNVVWLSAGTRYTGPAGHPDELGGRMYIAGQYMIADSVADRNLDGKRELVATHADPYTAEPGNYRAKYFLDTFLSAPLPIPETLDPPVEHGSGLEFGGVFQTANSDGSRTLAGRPYVEVRGPAGTGGVVAGPILDMNQRRTRVAVVATAAELHLRPACDYRYRLLLDNSRGVLGASGWGQFDYRSPDECKSGGGTKLRGSNRPDVLKGTSGNDKIRGRGGADRIKGRGGDDTLRGGAGDDRINGGAGRDRIDGGTGGDLVKARDGEEDRIACGPGDDRAVVDRRDLTRGCERLQGPG